MKKITLFTLLSLFVWSIALPALATDLILQTGSQITVDGMTFTITGNVDEIVVYPTYFTVTMTNSNATVVSDDRYTLSADYGSFECWSSHSQLNMINNSERTYTITPSNTVCTVTSYSGGGGGGGGASAGSSNSTGDSTPITTTTPLTSLDSYSSGGGTVSLASPVTQTVFSSAESTVGLSDNSLSLSVPAGTVSDGGTLSITPQASYAQPTAGYVAVNSQAFEINLQSNGSEVTQLNNNVALIFNYTDEQITGLEEGTLVVSYWNENLAQWVDLNTTVDSTNNTLTATTDHFTKFIIQAKSTTVPAGSLIKTNSNPAVYYLGHDGKRYTFNDDKIFNSWYTNFDDVLTVSDAEMYNFPLGGNVTVRPGTKLIQFVGYSLTGDMVVSDPKVYAVEPGGVRRWIETAEVAQTLYGSSWEQKIYAVPTTLAGLYTSGSPITDATYPSGSVVKETLTNNLYFINR